MSSIAGCCGDLFEFAASGVLCVFGESILGCSLQKSRVFFPCLKCFTPLAAHSKKGRTN